MVAQSRSNQQYPEGQELHRFVDGRKRMAQIWYSVFLAATIVGVIALLALLYNVINDSFGYVAYQNQIEPAELVRAYYEESGRPAPAGALDGESANLAALPKADLVALLTANVSRGRARALVA